MTVEKYIEEFNKSKDKKEYVEKHIINKYINYENKISECKKIIDNTSHKIINGKSVYWKNTPQQRLLFIIRLIVLYTDIELGNEESILSNYNELNKNGVIIAIMSCIPELEYREFEMLLSMTEEDCYENEKSISSLLETKFEALGLSFGAMSDGLEEILKQQN